MDFPDGPTEPSDEPPLFAGSILGLRSWAIVADPVAGCTCGLYAWHPRIGSAHDLLDDHLWAWSSVIDDLSLLGMAGVAGVVEASGRIELHHSGFRAERARPVALLAGSDWPEESRTTLRGLAARYGAEVLVVSGVEDVLEWCEDRGGVLGEALVDDLVGPFDHLNEPWRGPPAPATGFDKVVEIASRVVEFAVIGVFALISVIWWAAIAGMAVFMFGAIFFGWADEEPEPRPATLTKAWIDPGSCAVQVAVDAREPLKHLTLRVTGRDGGGVGLGHLERDVGPVTAGRSRIELGRPAPSVCRRLDEHRFRVRTVWPDGLGPKVEFPGAASGTPSGPRPREQ